MKIDFEKYTDGLVPVIVQHYLSQEVLMLGYVNAEALAASRESGKMTFYSRSKKRLWTKGEESGNFLEIVELKVDCDADALLARVIPSGPTCHTGTSSCFGEADARGFLYKLEAILDQRLIDGDEKSYTKTLAARGVEKVAQKVGEEAVETVIEALSGSPDRLAEESADLLFHFLLLLRLKGMHIKDVEAVLAARHRSAG